LCRQSGGGKEIFMIDKAICNLLIPFSFKTEDWDKIDNCKKPPSKEIIEDIKRNVLYDSEEWFSFCFKNLPVHETFQLKGSPLICNAAGNLVKRIEFNQPVRAMLGLHPRENRLCTLKREQIDFKFGKIRLLFFKFGLGMVHLEIESCDLSTDELLNFSEQLAAIQKDVKFSYENKVSRDSTETIERSIKQVIEKVLSVQNYIKLSPYKKETFGRAYIQEYLVGNIDQSISPHFFEMLRNQRRCNMRSATEVDSCYSYKPFEYITWIAGEKTLVCYSDMNVCGDDNRTFLTEPGGLAKSINLNYITLYAYLIVIQSLLKNAEVTKEKELADLLHNLPIENLSDEVHINELFDVYINRNLWKLSSRIDEVWNECQSCLLSEQMDHVSKTTDHIAKQVDYIVSFTNNELKSFLDEERRKLQKIKDANSEAQVGEFINHTATYIDEKIGLSGDEIIKEKRKNLSRLFGERWQYLLSSSQTSLVSAGTLLTRCSDINIPNFDYSGICICATAALEAELKRVFFVGLLDYMVNHYGKPGKVDANKIYEYWPDVLLTVPKYKYVKKSKLQKVNHFTMGDLPFLFGETRKLSNSSSIRKDQLKQAEMMKARMSEYLSTIVLDYYKEIPYEAFYVENKSENQITCKSGCFVWKCEQIRDDYRNKAAHVNVMTKQEASGCYQSIITKPDIYEYNAEIAGAILELFSKIDGNKLRSFSHSGGNY
jgi:hypothetical protein